MITHPRITISRADADALPISWNEGTVLARRANAFDYWHNLCVPNV